MEADYCIVATGARNPAPERGNRADLRGRNGASATTCRANRPHRHSISSELEGYIWVPRCGQFVGRHLRQGRARSALRARLERYMREQELSRTGPLSTATFCPASTPRRGNGIVVRAMDGWRSAMPRAWSIRLPRRSVLRGALRRSGRESHPLRIARSRGRCTGNCCAAILWGSRIWLGLANRVFPGLFCGDPSPPDGAVHPPSARNSRDVMQDLFAGTQPYRIEAALDEKPEWKPARDRV